jgi:hypothetical protein
LLGYTHAWVTRRGGVRGPCERCNVEYDGASMNIANIELGMRTLHKGLKSLRVACGILAALTSPAALAQQDFQQKSIRWSPTARS